MRDRIKQVRKHFNLSQAEFGEQLGVSRDAISNYELGRVIPTTLFVNHLCSTYNINRSWLMEGEGEMFLEQSRDIQIMEFVNKALVDEDDTFKKRLITALIDMTVEEWEALEKLINRLAQSQK